MRYLPALCTLIFGSILATQIDVDLQKKAQEYGYKSANLYQLSDLIENRDLHSELSLLGIKLRIPPFCPISSSQILSFLIKNGLDLKQQWAKIIDNLSIVERSKIIQNRQISEKWANALNDLKGKIKNRFNHPKDISSVACQSFFQCLDLGSTLIVRSTGMEDQIDLSNAGGNESIKHVRANRDDLFSAIGEVVASYFSEKSISQRLLALDPTIFDLPIIPVLIQEMVGCNPLEAVIHTTEQSGPTPTLSSFNCGYGIVNSQRQSDLYYYFPSGIGHAVLAKDIPHLSINERKAIHRIGQVIESYYNRPTDIELLVTKEEGSFSTIHLVQARPIHRSNSTEPTYLSSLGNKKNVFFAETVVAAGCYVRFISTREECIFAKTLKEALEYFLFKIADKDRIKAIIVEREAEPNSHEASTFASLGKAVFCIKKRSPILEWNSFYLDPQQGAIVKADGSIEYSQGFVTHPIPLRVSIEPFNSVPFPFAIVEYEPKNTQETLFQMLKSSEEKKAIYALSSLLFRLQKNLTQSAPLTAAHVDFAQKMDSLSQFARKKALDLLSFLKLPPYDLKRLAAIKPIEALFIQEEDPAFDRCYSLQSVLKKHEKRLKFINKLPAQSPIMSDLKFLDPLSLGLDMAMSFDLKEKWLQWISKLNIHELSSLSEMIQNLFSLDALSAWMQIAFAKTDRFDELYQEYKEALEILKKVKNEHDRLSFISASDWDRPDQFDHLMSLLPFELFQSDEWKQIFQQPNRLKQILALALMNHFIDTFDEQFIKTLLKSQNHTSKEQKVYHFKKGVIAYFSLLQAWEPLTTLTQDAKSWAFADFIDDLRTDIPLLSSMIDFDSLDLSRLFEIVKDFPDELFEELPETTKDLICQKFPSASLKEGSLLLVKERFANLESFQSYVEKIKRGIELTNSFSEKELLPPSHFNVASEIFVNISKKQEKVNFDGYTLAAFFTLIHQNINSILANLAIGAGLDQFKRPPLLQSVEERIAKLGFLSDESGQRKSPSLIGARFQNGAISLFYNLPLKLHGVLYEIQYVEPRNEIKLHINFVSIDNDLITIGKLFEIGASFINATDVSIQFCDKDLLFSCALNASSQIELLDLFLQSMQELASSKFKNPNQKLAKESTDQFSALIGDEEYKTLLENL